MRVTPKAIERFWSKVATAGDKSSCWEWRGSLFTTGYGQFHLGGRPVGAHRVSWTVVFGNIPRGSMVLHRCHNRRCVRPSHLYTGTAKDNARDAMRAGRHTCQNHKPKNNPVGEQNPNSKLTAGEAADVRRLYDERPITIAEICSRFGIAESTVRQIGTRATWRHLGDDGARSP